MYPENKTVIYIAFVIQVDVGIFKTFSTGTYVPVSINTPRMTYISSTVTSFKVHNGDHSLKLAPCDFVNCSSLLKNSSNIATCVLRCTLHPKSTTKALPLSYKIWQVFT
jgi:hypothetical protein